MRSFCPDEVQEHRTRNTVTEIDVGDNLNKLRVRVHSAARHQKDGDSNNAGEIPLSFIKSVIPN